VVAVPMASTSTMIKSQDTLFSRPLRMSWLPRPSSGSFRARYSLWCVFLLQRIPLDCTQLDFGASVDSVLRENLRTAVDSTI
jgi:hypothetical protein